MIQYSAGNCLTLACLELKKKKNSLICRVSDFANLNRNTSIKAYSKLPTEYYWNGGLDRDVDIHQTVRTSLTLC